MYVDVFYAPRDSLIRVVERINGERVYKEYPANYTFYINDPVGRQKSIYGDPVKKVVCRNYQDYQKQKKVYSRAKTWEIDVNPVARCLEEHYLNCDMPNLNVAFFDIETDFDRDLGYSSPQEAFNEITSIAVYMQWMKQMVCLAVPPMGMSMGEARQIAQEVGDTIIFETEKEMLEAFLTLIDDADVLSGWNSELFDIPYTVNRIIKKLGKHEDRKMCLFDQRPKKKTVERFGKENQVYDLTGRVHLDYLDLYKKYTYEERQSYSLNAIAEIELGEQKVDYEGTLDQLYNHDFKLFLQYNIQDTMLLERLDKKLQYIELANTIAHSNCGTIQQTMGTVALTDQAIMIEAHSNNLVVHNKKPQDPEAMRAAGGWVQEPKKGLHKYVSSVDLNSLYPSVIRAWNMSNETIIGQVRTTQTNAEIKKYVDEKPSNTFAGWWNDRFNTLEMENFFEKNNYNRIFLDFENGESFEITGADLHDLIFKDSENWCISANGTIFKNDKPGIIPSLLTRWYKERKQMQGLAKSYIALKPTEGIPCPEGWSEDATASHINEFDVDTAFSKVKLQKMIDDGDEEAFAKYIGERRLVVKDNRVIASDEAHNSELLNYWDKRQLVKKINLNSLYGGLLNEHSRFYDQRLGQSTTLSGRCVTRHMASKVNEFITGEYDHGGEAMIYGDTDSCYFTAYPILENKIKSGEIEWDKDIAIDLYDQIADGVNASYNDFAMDTFKVPYEYANGVLASGREIVASSALYIVKKRYAALVYDDEGERKDVKGKPGKLKAMGLDLRRSDTPPMVQKFLSSILLEVLQDRGEREVIEMIRDFKDEFRALPSWEKGSPKAVNNLTKYRGMLEEYKRISGSYAKKVAKPHIPGHVTASLNWNTLRDKNADNTSQQISDGQKIIVCKLKESANNKMKSIAYPVDETHLPEWFINLPFDDIGMMESVVDKKVENLLKVLKWDLDRTSQEAAVMETLFDFDNM